MDASKTLCFDSRRTAEMSSKGDGKKWSASRVRRRLRATHLWGQTRERAEDRVNGAAGTVAVKCLLVPTLNGLFATSLGKPRVHVPVPTGTDESGRNSCTKVKSQESTVAKDGNDLRTSKSEREHIDEKVGGIFVADAAVDEGPESSLGQVRHSAKEVASHEEIGPGVSKSPPRLDSVLPGEKDHDVQPNQEVEYCVAGDAIDASYDRR